MSVIPDGIWFCQISKVLCGYPAQIAQGELITCELIRQLFARYQDFAEIDEALITIDSNGFVSSEYQIIAPYYLEIYLYALHNISNTNV